MQVQQHRFAGYALAAGGAALFSTKAIFIKLAFRIRSTRR